MGQLIEKLAAFNKVMMVEKNALDKRPIPINKMLKHCTSLVLMQRNSAGLPTDSSSDATFVKRGVQVDIDCPANLTINGNEEMLRLCISELMENAIKFNNKMEKIIKVQVANHGDSISLSVRDYGVGVRPQDVENLFKPFFQVDDDFTGQVNGWGLGLSMVQRVVTLHGGTVNVVSDRGLGSIFTLKFPL